MSDYKLVANFHVLFEDGEVIVETEIDETFVEYFEEQLNNKSTKDLSVIKEELKSYLLTGSEREEEDVDLFDNKWNEFLQLIKDNSGDFVVWSVEYDLGVALVQR